MSSIPSKFKARDIISAEIEKNVLLSVVRDLDRRRDVIKSTLEQIEREMPDITELTNDALRILHHHVAIAYHAENDS